jgi:hypothetical protein
MNSEAKELVAEARSRGWKVKRAKKHVQLLSPGGTGIVTIAKTASDYRAHRNARADIRRIEAQEAQEGLVAQEGPVAQEENMSDETTRPTAAQRPQYVWLPQPRRGQVRWAWVEAFVAQEAVKELMSPDPSEALELAQIHFKAGVNLRQFELEGWQVYQIAARDGARIPMPQVTARSPVASPNGYFQAERKSGKWYLTRSRFMVRTQQRARVPMGSIEGVTRDQVKLRLAAQEEWLLQPTGWTDTKVKHRILEHAERHATFTREGLREKLKDLPDLDVYAWQKGTGSSTSVNLYQLIERLTNKLRDEGQVVLREPANAGQWMLAAKTPIVPVTEHPKYQPETARETTEELVGRPETAGPKGPVDVDEAARTAATKSGLTGAKRQLAVWSDDAIVAEVIRRLGDFSPSGNLHGTLGDYRFSLVPLVKHLSNPAGLAACSEAAVEQVLQPTDFEQVTCERCRASHLYKMIKWALTGQMEE